MGESYRQCTECGKRALSIATRCPGCGRELPAPEVPQHGGVREWRGLFSPQGAALVLAVLAVLASARLGRSSQPAGPEPESPEEESSFVAPDASPDFSAVASSVTTTAPAGRISVGGTASEPAGLRVARTWTHVRKSRSRKAELEAVLLPGDTVLADSLGRDWYRVALEGEVLGYAHRSTLGPVGDAQPEAAAHERRLGS